MKKKKGTIYFETNAAPAIIGGKGSVDELGEAMSAYGANTVLLVSDERAEKSGSAERVRVALDASGIKIGANYVSKGAADYATVYSLRDAFRINNCEAIVACGGEEVVNAAKALRILLAAQVNTLDEIVGVDVAKAKSKIPFAVLPEGIDTSSSVMRSAYVKNDEGEGKEIRSSLGNADVCIVNPNTQALGDVKDVVTGTIEVLSGNIESFISPNAIKLTKSMNLFAIRAIRDNLPKVIQNIDDVGAVCS